MTIRKMLSVFYPNNEYKSFDGRFGIEIETEVMKEGLYPLGTFKTMMIPNPENPGGPPIPANAHGHPKYDISDLPEFEGHVDSSLRNFGMEFVFKEPLDLQKAFKALERFDTVFKKVPFLNSPACSTHVHVNILEEETLTVANFLTIWTLYENILVNFCGENRRSNLFALPIRVADKTAFHISNLLERISKGDRNYFSHLHPNHVKYAALNLACINKIGSLEVRPFRGVQKAKEIYPWLIILQNMMEFSRIEGLTPLEILREYRKSRTDLFSDIFRDMSMPLKESLDFETFTKLVEKNLFYTLMIVESVQDWKNIDKLWMENSSKKKPRKALMSDYINIQGSPASIQFNQNTIHSLNQPIPTHHTTIIEDDIEATSDAFDLHEDDHNGDDE